MKAKLAALAMALAAPAAFAGERCPDVPRDQWLSGKEVQSRLEARGYQVDRVKREGSCFEVYAKNRDGKRVEAYVNPADGSIVKERVKS